MQQLYRSTRHKKVWAARCTCSVNCQNADFNADFLFDELRKFIRFSNKIKVNKLMNRVTEVCKSLWSEVFFGKFMRLSGKSKIPSLKVDLSIRYAYYFPFKLSAKMHFASELLIRQRCFLSHGASKFSELLSQCHFLCKTIFHSY